MNVQGDLRFVSDNDIERIGGEEERKDYFNLEMIYVNYYQKDL